MPQRSIPRRLHQFWIGPSPAPTRWMQTWRDAHPDWEYTLWDERAVRRMRLRNARLYRRLCDIGRYDGASDVARAEILLRHGGVYVDADSECLRPLDGAPFLEAGFFAVQDPLPEAGMAVVRELLGDVDHLLAGGFMGGEPGHPILRRYVDALSRVLSESEQLTPTWITTGGILLMKVIGDDPQAEILPSWTFFDRTLEGTPVIGGEPYARHFWSSTAGRDAHHAGAMPYPGQAKGSVPEEYDARAARAVFHRMARRGKRFIHRVVGSDRR
jgi:inositol phosphorylceramide mannosyltransferase catalytic subunit